MNDPPSGFGYDNCFAPAVAELFPIQEMFSNAVARCKNLFDESVRVSEVLYHVLTAHCHRSNDSSVFPFVVACTGAFGTLLCPQ